MTFPGTPLQINTELMLDGTWTDVSGDVYNREAMSIKHGRADEGSRADTSSLQFTLNNRDGKYSPRNPRSPLYGKLGRNTPVRVSVDGGESYLALDGDPANYVSTPDHTSLDLTTGLDLAAEVSIDWRRPDNNQVFIGKWETAGEQRSYMFRAVYLPTDNTQRISLLWSSDGTAAGVGQAIFNLSFPPRRYAVRMTMVAATGDVHFFTADTLAGPWIDRGSVTFGAQTIFNSTAPLKIGPNDQTSTPPRNPFIGQGHRFEVRNGVGGPVVAAPDFRALTPGITSFTDSAAKLWTLNGNAAVSNRHTRFEGEISSWPARWEPSGNNVWVPITAAGIRRRLGQRIKTLESTLRKRVPAGKPLAYWPLEEGADATESFSGLSAWYPIRLFGFDFAADDSLGGSAPLPKVGQDGGRFSANVPNYSGQGWHVEMPFNLPALPPTEQEFLRVSLTNAGGGVSYASVRISTAGIKVGVYDADDAVVAAFTHVDPNALAEFAGDWNRLQMFPTQSGTSTYLNVRWLDVTGGTFFFARTVYTGTAGLVGRATRVSAHWGTPLADMAFGHLAVFRTGGTVAAGGAIGTTVAGVTIYEGADDGFQGEFVAERMERLCLEQNVPYQISAFYGTGSMGSQKPDTFLALLDDGEDVDGGMVYDSREGRTVAYRSRSSQYNQAPRMVLDYAARREVAQPFEPVEDDQTIRNDVTRSRRGGASYRAVQEDGALSVLYPPAGVGPYEEQLEVNVSNDSQLPDRATWALRLGTWDEARYPVLNMRLHGAPHLIPNVLALELLDRIDVVNPPEWLPGGPIRLLVQGYEEILSLSAWELSFNCEPYGPWEIGEVEDFELGRADTSGSELSAAAGSTDTSLLVTTTDGPEWIMGAPNALTDPVFETGIGTWICTRGASIGVTSWERDVVHSGRGAVRLTRVHPTDTGTLNMSDATGGAVPALPGQTWKGSAWVYSNGAAVNAMRVNIIWKDGAGVETAVAPAGTNAKAGDGWILVTHSAIAPAGTVSVRLSVEGRSAWTVGEWWVADDVRLARTDTLFDADMGDQFPFDVMAGGEQMTVTSITGAADDAFTRTMSNGWGTSNTGNVWTTNGGTAADYSTSSGAGNHVMNTANVIRHTLTPAPSADVDIVCDWSLDKTAITDSNYVFLMARYTDTTHMYIARIQVATGTQALSLGIRKRNGSETVLGTPIFSGTYTPGTFYTLRFQVIGSTLRAKFWQRGTPEPDAWNVETTDTDLTAAGFVGCRTLVGSTSTQTLPVTASFDNFQITNVQRFAVTRSVNGVVKAQAAGTDVRLASPAIVAF